MELRWFDGSPVDDVSQFVSAPSSAIHPERPSMRPVLERIHPPMDHGVWCDVGWDGLVLELDRRSATVSGCVTAAGPIRRTILGTQ